jgi:hypothetical protein
VRYLSPVTEHESCIWKKIFGRSNLRVCTLSQCNESVSFFNATLSKCSTNFMFLYVHHYKPDYRNLSFDSVRCFCYPITFPSAGINPGKSSDTAIACVRHIPNKIFWLLIFLCSFIVKCIAYLEKLFLIVPEELGNENKKARIYVRSDCLLFFNTAEQLL